MALRTGLPTAVRLTRGFCKFLSVWKPSVISAVTASPLSTADKDAAIAALNAVETACDVFSQLAVKWE